MPSREEIVSQLRDASWLAGKFALTFDKNSCSRHEYMTKSEEYAERAAQVSSMRCETCKWSDDPVDESVLCLPLNNRFNNNFGCFNHEQKPAG